MRTVGTQNLTVNYLCKEVLILFGQNNVISTIRVINGLFTPLTRKMILNVLIKALPIFMDAIIPAWFTILTSAPLVTVFAEVMFVLTNAATVVK